MNSETKNAANQTANTNRPTGDTCALVKNLRLLTQKFLLQRQIGRKS